MSWVGGGPGTSSGIIERESRMWLGVGDGHETLIFLLTAFFPSPALLELVPFVEVLYSVLKISPIYFSNITNFRLNLPPYFQSK